jgi:glutamine cyclotransferase
MLFILGLTVLLAVTSGFSCSNNSESPVPSNSDAIIYTYNIVNTYPHDRTAFTQGLVFEDDVLYEGTGQYGHSTLRRVELETGDILQIRELSDQFFGEGITIYGDEIIQITWKSNVGFVYDKNSFELMSDGTSTLRILDPQTFEEIGQLEVFDNDTPITRLNELEYIQGEIYANVWQEDWVVRIAPQTGRVVGWIDLRGLLTAEDRSEPVDVLNGIAYDAEAGRLFVTGKWWPKLFEIELISS